MPSTRYQRLGKGTHGIPRIIEQAVLWWSVGESLRTRGSMAWVEKNTSMQEILGLKNYLFHVWVRVRVRVDDAGDAGGEPGERGDQPKDDEGDRERDPAERASGRVHDRGGDHLRAVCGAWRRHEASSGFLGPTWTRGVRR